MPGQKFFALVAGKLKEVFSIQATAGAGDAGKIIAADATGKIDASFLPVGLGPETFTGTASEALAAGDLVNIYDSGAGVMRVRKADNTSSGKDAKGFVLAAVANAGTATVYLPTQINTQKAALTPGAEYWLGAAGGIVQYIGFARDATTLITDFRMPLEVS